MTDERWDRLDALAAAAHSDEPPHWYTVEFWESFLDGEDFRTLMDEDIAYLTAITPATIRDLVAAARERDKLREALIGLDAAFQWIENEYPKALTAMPSPLFGAFFKARAALHSKDGAS